MNDKGIGYSYWPEIDEWRAVHIIERVGTFGHSENVWQSIESISALESMMREARLEGFTLFYQPTRKGWQMSVRRKGESGWDVKLVSEDQAQRLLAMLQPVGHPDGPVDLVSEVCRHGIPLVQICRECDEEDGREGIPIDRGLRRALAANAEAWDRMNELLGRWIAL